MIWIGKPGRYTTEAMHAHQMQEVLFRISDCVPTLSDRELNSTCQALVSLKIRDSYILKELCRVLKNRLQRLHPDVIVRILWACANLKFRIEPRLLDRLADLLRFHRKYWGWNEPD